jgi:putative membrane protein insertion efficiency factor
MKKALIALISFYQKAISPYLIRSCRHFPTCSEYAAEAINRFGIFKGTFLSVKRILRCNPFFRGGFDPVPKK